MSKQADIIAEALTWLNTPYEPRGRVKGVGVDCGGMIYEIFNPFYGPFGPYPDYPPDWAMHMPMERYLGFLMPYVVEIPRPQPATVSLFHLDHTLAYGHAAIYLGNGDYIHAWGRQRGGSVMITKARALNAISAKGFKPKHFGPKYV